MNTILKTAAIAALITGFANTAQAMDFTPLTEAPGAVYLTAELEDADCFGGYAPEGFTQSMASRTLAQETLKTGPENAHWISGRNGIPCLGCIAL